MRISDWSSDVCSSDLFLDRFDADIGVVHRLPLARPGAVGVGADRPEQATVRGVEIIGGVGGSRQRSVDRRHFPTGLIGVADRRTDRAVARSSDVPRSGTEMASSGRLWWYADH